MLAFFISLLAAQLSSVNVDAGENGEVAMILYLLVMGVNTRRQVGSYVRLWYEEFCVVSGRW